MKPRTTILLAVLLSAGVSFAAPVVGKAMGWAQFTSTSAANPCTAGKACVYPQTSDGQLHVVDTSGNSAAVMGAMSSSAAWSATQAFDCKAATMIHITIVTGNTTAPTMTSGAYNGARCTIVWQKDGTATQYTVAGWASNVRATTLTFGAATTSLLSADFVWDDKLATPAWVLTHTALAVL